MGFSEQMDLFRPLRWAVAFAALAALSSCGVAYVSSSVNDAGGDGPVRVVPLTAQSLLEANQQAYNPRTLPAVFSQTAGAVRPRALDPGTPGGAGVLPRPVSEPQFRPSPPRLVAPPDPENGPYRIGVGDVLVLATSAGSSSAEQIAGLLAAQNRRQGYTVQDDGAIAVPDVGRVRLSGLTLEEAEESLFRVLVENQIDPSFSLEIAEFNSKRVSVGGQVTQPTIVPISLTPLTLEAALTAAGGIRPGSDPDYTAVRIYRGGNFYQLPLADLYGERGLADIPLTAGDAVYVDTSFDLDEAQAWFREQISLVSARSAAQAQQQRALESAIDLQLAAFNQEVAAVNQRRAALEEARANFETRLELGAEARDYVYLAGEVKTQGRFALPFENQAVLADALYSEGGISAKEGNPAQIYVLRGSDHPAEFGAVTAWNLDARNAANLLLATRFELRPGDVIFVAEQPITRWNRVVSQIVPSLITSGVAAATR